MNTTLATTPDMPAIGIAQNEQANLRLQVAARHFYSVGKRLQLAGSSVNLILALVSPLILLFEPDWGAVIGAIAGGWLFVSRQFLDPFKLRFQAKGATAQELFDCSVLGLSWNAALVRPMADEEISGASRTLKALDKLRNWYPTESHQPWPTSVLVCQRANAVWARRQHRVYAYLLRGAAVVWALVGITIALLHGASLGDYLVTIALPSLPALLDASELSGRHLATASSRESLEEQVDTLLQDHSATAHELREIQDQLFTLRQGSPIVPGWFYNVVRSRYEQDMRYAATQHAGKVDPTDGTDRQSGL